ncbi:adenylate/guanylate cyclase domain-containing protein [Mycobacterium asiaticum]|uniref:adenylate/guanylate cyclase domain-containing protein n=1 Tax=Mycobacterium asiaticum TaxID=1790 RepID=UPI0005677295|nr:adenylate/guanylate cyclase domain-containing protein [Mycobacterium asiaticum]ORA17807.1 adenylate/guanylate cyclase domain-containing protein [Mycobacterium asiaticum DSM 44297]
MERFWQKMWDWFGPRYSWAVFAFCVFASMPAFSVGPFLVVAFEKSGAYIEAAGVTFVAALVTGCVYVRPGHRYIRAAEQSASGVEVDRVKALEGTYTYGRRAVVRALFANVVCGVVLLVVVGAITGATHSRLPQYGIIGLAAGLTIPLIGGHSFIEAALRPARAALAGDSGVGDSLPRSRPTFAAWTYAAMVMAAFGFSLASALLAATFNQTSETPLLCLVIAFVQTIVLTVPVTLGLVFSPSLQPIRDLAAGTERVAAGDYSQRLPVVQDDDLGALAGLFNRMQTGLAERQRLQTAFGTYVDPALATRLLEQGDEVFSSERREVSVVFIDVRDFTPFAETNTAEDTVARLNALFEIVVPTVVRAGGHVNKFLGDGALAVFGAPNDLADSADSAVRAAVLIDRQVAQRFGGELRIGIGINTGLVIAGTIGGGGKLEFTLIGDAVNVAARVEQLTKSTGDAILLTQQCVDSMASRPPGLIDRGLHVLKGKSAAVHVFGLDQDAYAPVGLAT